MARYSASIRDAIAEGIAKGATLSGAAQKIGVCRQTAHRWYNSGKEGGKHKDFYEAVCAAVERLESSAWEKIQHMKEAGEVKKFKTVTDAEGNVTETKEMSAEPDLAAIRYLLDKRFGYDRVGDKHTNKAVNTMVAILREEVSVQDFDRVLDRFIESFPDVTFERSILSNSGDD